MRKHKKTTDAVLRDIFDPVHSADEKSAHPLENFTGNKIESLVEEKPVKVSPEIFREPVVQAAPAASEIHAPAQVSKIPVIPAVIFVLVFMALLFGFLIYSQNQQIRLKQATAKSVTTVSKPDPVLSQIDLLNHRGVSFKNYFVKNKKLMLRGFAADQAVLASFLNSMNNSPYFKHATLSSIQFLDNGLWKQKSYAFQIYADINR